jgi:hypothetical protein
LGETVIKLDKFLKRARNEKVTTYYFLPDYCSLVVGITYVAATNL